MAGKLTKAEIEKLPLSAADKLRMMAHYGISMDSSAPTPDTGARAPGAADADTARAVPVGNANDSGAPMFAEAKKAAKGAKPVAPPKGTGTVEFMANTRQGVRPIKENITSPADVDRLVASEIITPEEGAAYKAEKWPAAKPPQAIVADLSGKSTKGKKTSGAEMSAEDTAQASMLKKSDKEMRAWDPVGNAPVAKPGKGDWLSPIVVAPTGNGLPMAGPPGAPVLPPGAPSPVASKYAYGMENDPAPPALERFQTSVGDAAVDTYEALNFAPIVASADDKKKKGAK